MRLKRGARPGRRTSNFPSFSEGLSLRLHEGGGDGFGVPGFPFLFGRAFIEAVDMKTGREAVIKMSLPFRKGFH